MKSALPIMLVCVVMVWIAIILALVIAISGDYNDVEPTAMLNYSPMIRSS